MPQITTMIVRLGSSHTIAQQRVCTSFPPVGVQLVLESVHTYRNITSSNEKDTPTEPPPGIEVSVNCNSTLPRHSGRDNGRANSSSRHDHRNNTSHQLQTPTTTHPEGPTLRPINHTSTT